jgi:hypothetical protein
MAKLFNEEMRKPTNRNISREVVRQFARLDLDQANVNMISEQAREIAQQIFEEFGRGHSQFCVSLFC